MTRFPTTLAMAFCGLGLLATLPAPAAAQVETRAGMAQPIALIPSGELEYLPVP